MLLLLGISNSPLERGCPCRSFLGLMMSEQAPILFNAPTVAGRGVEMLVEGNQPNNHHSGHKRNSPRARNQLSTPTAHA